jgi:hypothetical protein
MNFMRVLMSYLVDFVILEIDDRISPRCTSIGNHNNEPNLGSSCESYLYPGQPTEAIPNRDALDLSIGKLKNGSRNTYNRARKSSSRCLKGQAPSRRRSKGNKESCPCASCNIIAHNFKGSTSQSIFSKEEFRI